MVLWKDLGLRHMYILILTILCMAANVSLAQTKPVKPALVIVPDPLAKCCEEITSVAFSPDGSMLAAKLYQSDFLGNQGIVLWDLARGSLIKGIEGPPDGVYSIRVGPVGHISVSKDNRIWDIQDGKAPTLVLPDDHIYTTAFSPDGKLIASSTGKPVNKITLWDAKTGNPLRVITSDVRTGKELQFSRNSKTLISTGLDHLQFWSIESGQVISTVKPECGEFGLYAYSDEGRTLAVTQCGVPDNNVIQLLDIGTGRVISRLNGHTAVIWSLNLNADGRFLVSASQDLTVKVWDTSNGNLLQTFTGHSKIVRTAVFSPDGQMIASGGGDNETKIWSIHTGELIATLRAFKDGNWIVYTPDGYYNRSEDAAKYIKWKVGGGLVDETLYMHHFFQPEIVAERLSNKQ